MTYDGKAPMCGHCDVMACDECTQAGRVCYHDRHPWDEPADAELMARINRLECTCGRAGITVVAQHLTPCKLRDEDA